MFLILCNIAKNLRRLRKARGLSQERLARLAEVANNTIVKIEAGKIKIQRYKLYEKSLKRWVFLLIS